MILHGSKGEITEQKSSIMIKYESKNLVLIAGRSVWLKEESVSGKSQILCKINFFLSGTKHVGSVHSVKCLSFLRHRDKTSLGLTNHWKHDRQVDLGTLSRTSLTNLQCSRRSWWISNNEISERLFIPPSVDEDSYLFLILSCYIERKWGVSVFVLWK